jgi:plasmid stabilization system protein ParE
MAEIIKLSRAADDLAEIWDYIAEDSETQADLFIDTMNRSARLRQRSETATFSRATQSWAIAS